MTELLPLWADLVARASFWPAVVLTFYALFLAAFLLLLVVQLGRALGMRLASGWRRRRLHLVESPDRERTLAAIATATPVITERGAWPETTASPAPRRLVARMARRRAERGEGGEDDAA